MKKIHIVIFALLLFGGGIVYANVPEPARNFWGFKTKHDIDDIIQVDARGNIYESGAYGTKCSFDRVAKTRSGDCGLNPSGKRDAMEFNYDSGGGTINQVGFFSDGRIAVDSVAPSDGSASENGAELEFDVEGAVGAQHYCDADGESCYTAQQLRAGMTMIDNNAAWPISPASKDIVFNRAGRTIQMYIGTADVRSGRTAGWEPTYTKYMQYNATEIQNLSPAPEIGDQLTSSDCSVVLTYNGTNWIDLTNTQLNLTTCAIIADAEPTVFTVLGFGNDYDGAYYIDESLYTNGVNGSGSTVYTNGTRLASDGAFGSGGGVYNYSGQLVLYANSSDEQSNTFSHVNKDSGYNIVPGSFFALPGNTATSGTY